MKFILGSIFFVSFLFADISSIFDFDVDESLKNLKEEVGAEKYNIDYKQFKQDLNFKVALDALNTKVSTKNKKVSNVAPIIMPKFDQALEFLLKSLETKQSFLKPYTYIAAHLGIEILNKRYAMMNKFQNKKYGLPFAKVLYKHGLCAGYLYYGRFLRDIKRDLPASVKVYKQGYENCKKDGQSKKYIGYEYYKWKIVLEKKIKWEEYR